MPSCERCWSEANRRMLTEGGSTSEHYHAVLKERDAAGLVCSPRERAGQFWDEQEQRDTRLPR